MAIPTGMNEQRQPNVRVYDTQVTTVQTFVLIDIRVPNLGINDNLGETISPSNNETSPNASYHKNLKATNPRYISENVIQFLEKDFGLEK